MFGSIAYSIAYMAVFGVILFAIVGTGLYLLTSSLKERAQARARGEKPSTMSMVKLIIGVILILPALLWFISGIAYAIGWNVGSSLYDSVFN